MQKYVLVYAAPVIGGHVDEVLCILKKQPEFQEGKLNLVGGKMEDGETPSQASIRELKEEAGLTPLAEPKVMGTIKGSWGEVFCIKIPVSRHELLMPDEAESEIVGWMQWSEIRNHEILLPNLRVIIPLIRSGLVDWTIKDENPSWTSKFHEFSVVVASHDKAIGEPIDRPSI